MKNMNPPMKRAGWCAVSTVNARKPRCVSVTATGIESSRSFHLFLLLLSVSAFLSSAKCLRNAMK